MRNLNPRQISRAVTAMALALFICSPISARQQHQHSGGSTSVGPEKLGKVSFPTSCAPAVQSSFERAVALLHSFQYQAAEKGFNDVAQKDPHCAMAHWGLAMSRYHQIWERPDADTRKRGRADAEKAQALGAKTEREREYIAAVAAFYKDDPKLDYTARATAYTKGMEEVYKHNPEDGEAAAFYSLALIAQPAGGHEAEIANRKKAIAILNKLFAEQPDQPGSAHYLIHAADVPELAPKGLDAARRYAKIAPSSAHALHMPSHIFTRLGLWQESVDSNLAAATAAEAATKAHMGDAGYQTHAMDFLQYAYLQTGRDQEARRLTEELKAVPGTTPEMIAYHLAQFPARTALELHRWQEAAALPPPPEGSNPNVRMVTYWARAIGKACSGDAAGARKDIEELDRAHADAKAQNKEYEAREGKDVDQQEAEAWLAYAEDRKEEAANGMRAAADREDRDGPDSLAMPAREMLADMLMDLGQPAKALSEYEVALREAPNRFDGLYGAARAAELSANPEKARTYYAKLIALCDHGDNSRSEINEARVFLARR